MALIPMADPGIDRRGDSRSRMDSPVWSNLLLLNMGITVYFMAQEPPARLVPGAAVLLAIAVLHLIAARGGRRLPVVIGAQLALTMGLGFVYHPMYMYLVFLTVYASMKLRTRQLAVMAGANAAAIIAMMVVSGYADNSLMWFNMLPPFFGGCILPFIVRASGRYREMAERLQAATSEVQRLAQQAERQRIALELHDTLGHTLSLLALKGELIEKLIPRAPDKAAAEAREVRETAGAALRRMRELVSDMKIVRLEEEWTHARMLCAAANVRLDIRDGLSEAGMKLTPLQESVLGMCIREAVTNVVRHSSADACTIELTGGRDFIRCTIQDNGEGFDSAGTAAEAADAAGADRAANGGGNGMIGMKQRLALLEGTLTVRSSRGGGTQLAMEIPVVRRDGRLAGGEAE